MGEPEINVNLCPTSTQVSYSLNNDTLQNKTTDQAHAVVSLDKPVVVVSVESQKETKRPRKSKITTKVIKTNIYTSKPSDRAQRHCKYYIIMLILNQSIIFISTSIFLTKPIIFNCISVPGREQNVPCENCRINLPSHRALREHTKKCSVTVADINDIKCFVCEEKFTTSQSYNEHLGTHCPETCDKCPICKKEFKKHQNLIDHLRIHSRYKVYECDDCEQVFTLKSHLASHLQLHESQKKYVCPDCDKTFNYGSYFKLHMKTHKGELPYKCEECEQAFVQPYLLKQHKQRKHNAGKNYTCEHCEKTFIRLTDYTVHQRVHTGEKPFKCPQCNKTFKQTSTLYRHQIIHNAEKPYRCKKCDKTFSDKSSKKRHETKVCKVPQSRFTFHEYSFIKK